MKAATRFHYGPPEALQVMDTKQPLPNDGELLLRVHATTVNRTDCAILQARPFIMRFFTGLFKPKQPITGTDFAGVVEATGRQAYRFRVGDRVCGFDDNGLASQAEYLTLSEDKAIARIPDNISFQEAVASLEGAHYAFYFIEKIPLKPGQKALVNGATGAIGSALVQFLAHHDLRVTAVCRGKHEAQVKALGAERVIDYTREDFTRDAETYDYVLDAVGKSTFFRCRRLLAKNGIYLSSELGPWSQNVFLALLTPLAGGKKVIFPIPYDIKKSMTFILRLLENGKFKPLLDKTYSLADITEAYRYVASGQKVGNVVITIPQSA